MSKAPKWLKIVGYEGYYEVSNDGQVRSVDRDVINKVGTHLHFKTRVIKQHLNGRGYLLVRLTRDCSTRGYAVHRLVALTFLDEPKENMTANHINGNKLDNRAKNLEWLSHQDNMKHALVHGLLRNKVGILKPRQQPEASEKDGDV
jgi:hypothetical protein